MAVVLVVETGEGLETSNSYATRVEFQAWVDINPDKDWPDGVSTDQQKDDALVMTTRDMDKIFKPRYRARKYTSSQALEWPRNQFRDKDGYARGGNVVPGAVKIGLYEMLIVTQGTTGVSPFKPINATSIRRESNATEQESKTVVYAVPKVIDSVGKELFDYPAIEAALEPVLHGSPRMERS